jgi:hypothetical protein
MFLLQPGPDANPVQINAALVAVTTRDREVVALVADQDGKPWLPSRTVGQEETSVVAAARLLYDLTGLTARTGPGTSGWSDLLLVDVHDNPANRVDGIRNVYVVYGVLFPYETPAKGRWARLTELAASSPELAHAACEVARKL